MFIDNNINEIQNHLKTVIKNTIDPKDIEILVNSYKNIGTPIIIDNNTSANLNLIDKQQKEIEEKSTIIMAGAEKVKQLEEEIEELKLITRQYNSYCIDTDDDKPRIILAHKHYFDSGVFTSNFISKDKIRKLIENYEQDIYYSIHDLIEDLKKILEES